MKKFLLVIGLLTLSPSISMAVVGSPIFRPGGGAGDFQYNNHGKFDGVSPSSAAAALGGTGYATDLKAGDTDYAQVRDTLQVGSTIYINEVLVNYRLGIGTNTPQAAIHQQESISSFGSNSGVLRIDVIRAFGFFTTNIFSLYSGANSTALTKEFSATLFSNGPTTQRIDFKNRDDIAVHQFEMMRGGEFTSGRIGNIRDNTVNVAGTIGLTTVEVAASTTTPKESAAYYLYRVDASAGAVVVTLASLSLPEIPFGRTQRFCKVDSSANSVTIAGVALTYTNQCVDFLAKPDPGFTTGSWVQMGMSVSTSAPISAGSGGSSSLEVFSNFDATRTSPTPSIAIGDSLKLTVVGSTSSLDVDVTSVTAQGNTFNTIGKLLKLDNGGFVPTSNFPYVPAASSHTHTGSTISGLDLSDDTNAAAGVGLILTDDTFSLNFTSVPSRTDVAASYQPLSAVLSDLATIPLTTDNSIDPTAIAAGAIPTDVTVGNASIDSSSVTKQGNVFNGASQLVQLNGSSQLPAVSAALLTGLPAANLTGTVPSSTLDSSSVTKQGNIFNGASQLVQTGATSLISNTNIDSSSVTKQGNNFNSASQLLKLDTSAFVPNANIDSSSVTKQGNTFNGASQLLKAGSDTFVPNANIDSSSVTKQGNNFNGANQLIKGDGSGNVADANLGGVAALTATMTNKTYDASATGNVFKKFDFALWTHPSFSGSISTATFNTSSGTVLFGQGQFAHNVSSETNCLGYQWMVPPDLDSSVAIISTFTYSVGASTHTHRYVIAYGETANSANPAALGNGSLPINFDQTADASGASSDIEQVTGTLTGWAAALTPGRHMVIQVCRDGDASQDASVVNSTSGPLLVRYGITQ